MLSRHPLSRDDQLLKDSPVILYNTLLPSVPPDIIPLFQNLSVEQQKDPKLSKIILLLNLNNLLSWHNYYTFKNNILFSRKFKHDTHWSLYLT